MMLRTPEESLQFLENDPQLMLIASVANQVGIPSYLVGGVVRDFLLDLPCKDIDIVCLGNALDLALALQEQLGTSKITIFKNYGTAMLKLEDREIELVGARKESYSPDSRKPEVSSGTLEEDQLRRDFTINALAISLNKEDFGRLLDPFNGISDLEAKIVRTPTNPDLTFSDDPLRMMRAIRFAARLGFDIEAETFAAIGRNKSRIEIVSAERITDEFNKIIQTKKPSYGFKLLHFSGLLQLIFPEFVELLGAQNVEGKTHKDNFYHTLEVLDNTALASENLWLRWAAILHDIAKPATKRFEQGKGWTFHGHEEKGAKMVPKLFRRFRLPLNEKMRYVQKLVRLHLRPIALVNEGVTDSALRRLMVEAGEDLEDLMVLCKADVTTKNPNKAKKYLFNFISVEEKMRIVEEKDKLRNFQPVITGEHLMELFGLSPSREVGELKEKIRQAILDGSVSNEIEPAMAYLLPIASKFGFKPIVDLPTFMLKLKTSHEQAIALSSSNSLNASDSQ